MKNDATRKLESKIHNLRDDFRGVVHLGNFGGASEEFSLCGLAFDEPASEWGAESMTPTDKPCTCAECAAILNVMLPYMKREAKRIGKTKSIDEIEEEKLGQHDG